MRQRLGATLILACSLGLLACGSESADATAVMLRVDADPEIKRTMRALNLRIHRERDGAWEQRLSRGWETDSRFTWPAELPLLPREDMLSVFEVVVEARAADGRRLAGTRAVATFSAHQVTALGLYLEAKCYMLNPDCEPTLAPQGLDLAVSPDECHGPSCKTCRAGQCVETRTSSLPTYQADEDVRELFERSVESSRADAGAASAGVAGSKR